MTEPRDLSDKPPTGDQPDGRRFETADANQEWDEAVAERKRAEEGSDSADLIG